MWRAGFASRAVATRSRCPSPFTSMRRGLKRHSLFGPSVRALAQVGRGDADCTRPGELATSPMAIHRRNDLLSKGSMAHGPPLSQSPGVYTMKGPATLARFAYAKGPGN